MKRDFTFNDGGKFINDLVEIGKKVLMKLLNIEEKLPNLKLKTAKWLKNN